MVEILALATIIAPITTAVVEAIKRAELVKRRFLPLLATVIGIGIGATAVFFDVDLVLRMWAGGISGLASTGLFELGKKSMDDTEEKD